MRARWDLRPWGRLSAAEAQLPAHLRGPPQAAHRAPRSAHLRATQEIHYNQHGLLLLEGRGIYRLGDAWYPVQAGDAIWMAPYVIQWYAALGTTRSRYVINKDTIVDPLLS